MDETKSKKVEAIYTKAITRLRELLGLEKQIITKHKKHLEEQKIEELRNKIKNNG